jgi:hypothetical protein
MIDFHGCAHRNQDNKRDQEEAPQQRNEQQRIAGLVRVEQS